MTFNEDVANVGAADFAVIGTTATLSVRKVTASTVYDVTASGGDLAGLDATVTLGFAASQDIVDMASNELVNTAPTGTSDNSYVVDNAQGICLRTAAVRTAILAEIPGVSNCADVTDADLASLTGKLNLFNKGLTTLATADFDGLTSLRSLDLSYNDLVTLPAGAFEPLTALAKLSLGFNCLITLPVGAFTGLTSLRSLDLANNFLTALPVGAFDGLTALTSLLLWNNRLHTLPVEVFDGLTALTSLDLNDNRLRTLPAGVFDELTALTSLNLNHNYLRTLPAGVFTGLTSLRSLDLWSNRLHTLPAGVFEELTALADLFLDSNPEAPFAASAVALPDDGTVSQAGGTVMLDGSGSGGAWGTNVTYSWALTRPASGVTVTFDDNATSTPMVTIPPLAEGTELTFTLTVTGRGAADGTEPGTDTAKVTVGIIAPRVTSIERQSPSSSPTNADSLTWRVTFSEDMANVGAADFAVTDTTAMLSVREVTASTVYDVTASRGNLDDLDATVTLDFAAGQDIADTVGLALAITTPTVTNDNSYVVDNTAPTMISIERQSPSSLRTNADSLTWRVTFSEDMANVGATDFTFTDRTATLFVTEETASTVYNVRASGGELAYIDARVTLDFAAGWDIFDEAGNELASTTPTGTNDNSYVVVNAEGICGRSVRVRGAILARISGVGNCADVTDAHLAAITGELRLDGGRHRPPLSQEDFILKAGDFAGMTALEELALGFSDNLYTLPVGVFDGLTALTLLGVQNGVLRTLPAGVFEPLTALAVLELSSNNLTTLPAGVFDGLTALTSLRLNFNPLTTLPAGVFDELTSLRSLWLIENPNLTTLPAGVFEPLTALKTLHLRRTGPDFSPEAVALDGTVSAGGTVTLDGSGSGGAWGARVGYFWALTRPESGVTVTFNNRRSATPVVTVPQLTEGTELEFTLTVTGHIGITKSGIALGTDTATVRVDNTAPGVTSIERQSPRSSPTNADSLTWRVTFSEGMANVDAADFAVPGTMATLSVREIPGSTVYDVTASMGNLADLDATVTLDFATSQDISDRAGNALVSTTPTVTNDNSYVMDNTAPTVMITRVPGMNGSSFTATFDFSEAVTGFSEEDITVGNGRISGFVGLDAMTYTATITPAMDGAFTVGVAAGAAMDAAGNGNAAAALETTAPRVASIVRQSPSSSPTNADSLTWRVTFSEDVANVGVADFAVTGTTATLSVTEETASTVYDVTASGGDLADLRGDTVTLDFAAGQDIVDMASNELVNTAPTGTSDRSYRVDSTGPGICGRTAVVRNAILAEISGVSNCADVTDADLAAITNSLDLSGRSISALVAWDFAGLTALTVLDLSNNSLRTLPAGVFDDLPALTELNLSDNSLRTLPAGVFDELTSLRMLRLNGNRLTTLPAGVFDDLITLTRLWLNHNPLTTLRAGVFDGLKSLSWLRLVDNSLTTLPAGVFDELTSLTNLRLDDNLLTTLPAGVFDELTKLRLLALTGTALTTLPAGVFDELTELTVLQLRNNRLTTLPAGVFAELTSLRVLALQGNRLTTLPAGVFELLTALTRLELADNPGAPFAPTAVALPDDGTVSHAGGTVMLDGSGSGRAWGTNVTYSWAQTRPASGVTFDDSTSATPVVTIPPLAAGTELTFTLTVTGRGASNVQSNGITLGADTAKVTVVDTTAPTVASIERQDPSSSPTNADRLTWRVTFSEDVVDVAAADFTFTAPTATLFVEAVSGSTAAYNVTASGGGLAGLDGMVTLGFADGQSIVDTAGNALASTTPTVTNDNSYVVDNTEPTVTIMGVPPTSSMPFLATFTFSEAVTGFSVADITVDNGAASGFTGSDALTYMATITPAMDGTVTVSVAAGVATDAAGNGNMAATGVTGTVDTTAPRVTSIERQSPSSSRTNADSLTWRVTFSEDVGDVDAADFEITAPTATLFVETVSGSTAAYDVTASGSGLAGLDGMVTLGFAADRTIADEAGNALASTTPTGANENSYVVDNTEPTVTIMGVPPTSSMPFLATFTFSEAVTGFSVADITVDNGAASGLTGSDGDKKFTATITAAMDGAVTVRVAAGVARDAAGNGNMAAIEATGTVDITAPTVASIERQDPSSSPTNADSLTWRVTFSEDVVGVDAADFEVEVTGPMEATLSVAGVTALTVYDVTASGSGLAGLDGMVTLGFAADRTIADEVGNAFDTTTQPETYDNSYVVDNTEPTVTIMGVPPTSSMPFLATFTFSEAVTGFSVADITVDNGAASGLTGSDGDKKFTATITAAMDGAVTVRVAAGVARDAAGNGNMAAIEATGTVDITAPTVASIERQDPSSSPTNADSLTWRVTFSEDVVGVDATDFEVEVTGPMEATLSVAGVTALTVYDVTASGSGLAGLDGMVTLGFAADRTIADGAGNALASTTPTGANENSYVVDNTEPTVTIMGVPPTSSMPFLATFDFSEAVTGFTVEDITVDNGAASAFAKSAGDKEFTATITAAMDGAVTVSVAAGVATDAAGNGNMAAAPVTGTVDTTAPTVASIVRQSPSSSPTNVDSLTWRVTFSEDVDNVDAADFAVTGTTATLSVTRVTASAYEVTISGGDLAGLDAMVTLDFAASQNIADGVGNALALTTPTGANENTYVVDNTEPTVTIMGVPSTSRMPFTATFDFSEAVTGFTVEDITVDNGAASAFAKSAGDKEFTATITAAMDGAVTVSVAAGVATDAAGNGNMAAAPVTGTVDTTAPMVASIVRQNPSSSPTNADDLTWRVTFSEDVDNVDAADFAVTGTEATATLFVAAVSSSTAAYDVTASGGGLADLDATVTLDFAASQNIVDTAGNELVNTTPTVTNDNSYVVDNTGPTVAIMGVPSTSSMPFTATFDFSEAVTGFSEEEITVDNGAASAFARSDAMTYTAMITAAMDGAVTVSVAAGVATDAAGNGNMAAARVTGTVDATAPVVTSIVRQGPSSSPTNADDLTWRVTFSEDVVGVDATDFAVTGTTATATLSIVAVSGSTAAYDVTASGGGLADLDATVTLDFAASQNIADGVGNALALTTPTGANENTYVVDNTEPTVTIMGVPSTSRMPFTATFDFSEAVTGFTVEDITVDNGAASAFAKSAGDKEFTATITAAMDGAVTVSVAAGVATDAAGNGNMAAAPVTGTVDTTAPTVASIVRQSPSSSPTNVDSLTWRVTFSEDMVDVDAADFEVTGTTAPLSVTKETASAYDVTASGGGLADLDATVTLDFAASQNIADGVGNALALTTPTGANENTYVVDNTEPTVTIMGVPSTSRMPFTATFDFSEAVTGFTVEDITVDNGAASAFAKSAGDKEFTATITAAMDGAVTVSVAAGVATDAAGNGNMAAAPVTGTVDTTAPMVASIVRQNPSSSPTNADDLTWRVTFSEDMVDVDAADFAVTGTEAMATLSVAAVSGSTAAYDVTASGGGLADLDATVTLDFAASQNIVDTAGNELVNTTPTVTNDNSYVVDNTGPTVAIMGVPSTSRMPFTATFDFSEAVTGFSVEDITVDNGAASALARSDAMTYTATITAAMDGAVTVRVAAGVALDAAGNGNMVAAGVTGTVDTTAPAVTSIVRQGPSSSPTNVDDLTWRVTFSEDVVGVDATDFAVTGTTATATLSIVAVSGSTAAYDVTASGGGLADLDATVTLDFAASQNIADGVGNALALTTPTGANENTYVVDNTEPTVTIMGVPSTSRMPFTATFDFSEAVTGFTVEDITVDNGAASAFAKSAGDKEFTATITAAMDGAVTVSVAAGVATDAAGNGNMAAAPVTGTVDTTAPTVASIVRQSPSSSPTNVDSLTWRVTFSEDMVDVDAADFAVTGTTATLSVTRVTASAYEVTISGGDLAGLDAMVTLDFAASQNIADGVGNALALTTPTGANENIYVVDNTEPTVTIMGVPSTSRMPFTATFDFSEAVTGFSEEDITVDNGDASGFTGSDGDKKFTATITAAADGAVTVSVAAGVATDAAGNGNMAAAPVTGTVDTTAPMVASIVRQNPSSSPTNADDLTWRVTFSEDVVGVDATDFAVTGTEAMATLSVAAVSGSTAAYDVTASGGGLADLDATVTLDFAASQNIVDTAGNELVNTTPTVTNDNSYVVDNTGPTVTIMGVPSTSNMPFTATFDFSEAVTGFSVEDITLDNGEASGFTESDGDKKFTATITAAMDGAVTVSVAAGVATDAAGNGNMAATGVTGMVETTAPTVASIVRQNPSSSPTNANSLTWRVTFSEDVENVDAADFAVTGTEATATLSVAAVSGSTAAYEVTASGGGLASLDGMVTLAIAADRTIADRADNELASTTPTVTNDNSYVVDNTAPTVTIMGVPSTSRMPFTAMFDFSEAVTGFSEEDITVDNGAASGFTGSDGDKKFTATITAAIDGAVTVSVAAGVATDAAGNGNMAATGVTGTVDATAPTVASIVRESPSSSPTNADDLTWRVTFSEDVDNVDAADFAVTGTTATLSVTRVTASAYEVTISGGDLAGLDAMVTLDFAASQNIADGVGNALALTTPTGANENTYVVDNTEPTVTIMGVPSTSRMPFTATFDFSEAVTGFTVEDITVDNGAASAFAKSAGDKEFTATITAAMDGAVTVSVAAGVATDAAGNGNMAAAPVTGTVDTTAPMVASIVRQNPSSSPTNADDLTWRVTFSEDMVDVDAADFAVTGTEAMATLSVAAVSGSTAAYDVTASGGGLADLDATVTLDFAASQNIVDTAGNELVNTTPTVTNDNSYVVDNTGPTVAIMGVPSTSSMPFTATFDFSEAVTGFSVEDITVDNGAASALARSDAMTYTATITAAMDGAVTVRVAAGVALDAAGNGNMVAAAVTGTVDATAPAVTSIVRQGPSSSPTNVDDLTWRVTFSEDVVGVDATDFAVTGTTATATLSIVAVSGSTAAYDVTASGGGLADLDATVTLDFAASQNIADGVGNALALTTPTGANENTYVVDNTEPTVTIMGVPSTSRMPFTATFDFSEAVTGFTVEDITVDNGAASAFAKSAGDKEFTATITAAMDGAVTVSVAAGVATDAAGNGNMAAAPVTGTVDTTAPTVASIVRQSPSSSPTNVDSLTWRVTFSEDVDNVDAADFAVTGTTATLSVTRVTASAYEVTASGGGLAGLDATVTLGFAAGQSIVDTAGNGLESTTPTVTNDNSYVVDNTAPTVTIMGVPSTSRMPFTATFTFSEAVTGFSVADITVDNGAASAFARSDAMTYTATITAAIDGAVTVSVAAGVALDAAGNGNMAATGVTGTVDTTAPMVASIVRQNPSSSPTNADDLTWRVTFSEDVVGVDATDFAVTGTEAMATLSVAAVSGSTAAYDVTASGGGLADLDATVTLDFAASQNIVDTAGNELVSTTPTVTNDNSYVVDNTAPTVTIMGVPSTSNMPFTATFDFSEAVTGFSVEDITLDNGEASGFTESDGDKKFTATITAAMDGAVTVSVAAGVATDAAGNGNMAATGVTGMVETTAPTVASIVRQNPSSSPTNANSLTWRVTFSEDVENVDAADFAVTGTEATATLSVAAVSGSTAAYEVTASGGGLASLDGMVTLAIAADRTIADRADNELASTTPTVTNDNSYVVDNTAPTVTIMGVPSTSRMPFTAMFDFSEAVTGFSEEDITVDNGAASGFTGSDGDKKFTATITAAIDGAVTVSVAAGVATDAAGNGNMAATGVTGTVDATAPTVASIVRESPSSSRTNADDLTWRVTFSEDVDNVDAADFAVTGTTATLSVTRVTASAYEVTISGGDLAGLDAMVTLDFAASQNIADGVGNALALTTPTGANENTYVVDNTEPTVTIMGVPSTSRMPFTATFTFSEAVTGFSVADITVDNGAASAFARSDAMTYTATITAAMDGAVTVSVAAGVATDATGNGNMTATSVMGTVDTTAPAVTSIGRESPSSSPTNADDLTWRVTFSEDVENVDAADFEVTGTTATLSVTRVTASAYEVTASGGNLESLDATVTLGFAAGQSIVDTAGLALAITTPTGTNDNSYVVDNTGPTVAIMGVPSTSRMPFTATFDFLEAVTGFSEEDITVDNGAASAFARSDAMTYTATITAAMDGAVTVSVAAGVALDAAGNGNMVATGVTGTVDTTAPTVASIVRQSPLSSPTNADDLTWRVTFSEDVVGVDATDFAVTGTTATATLSIVAVSGSTAAYDVTASGGGLADLDATVTLDFAASQNIADGVGNALALTTPTGANENTYVVDNTEPTVTIMGVPSTSRMPFTATFDFSEAVTGFSVTDITVDNGTASAFARPDAMTYTAMITAAMDGAVTVRVAAGVALDAAGNGNMAATEATVTVDITAPTVASIVRQNPSSSPTNADELIWRVTFSEDVENVDAADFAVTGTMATATLSVAEVSASTVYDVTASGGGLAGLDATVTLGFAAGQSIVDTAGNGLESTTPTVTNDNSYVVDNTAPTVTIMGVPSTSRMPFTATFTFSEAVTGFSVADITVDNGAASAFARSDAMTYTATITAAIDGAVTVSVAAGVALDAAGNGNMAATEATVTVDATAPAVTSIVRESPSSSPTNANSLTWRVTFSEDVVDVDAADFEVTGTAATLSVVEVPGSTAYDVTASGGNLADLDGTVTLDFAAGQNIADGAGNALDTTPTGANENSYVVDNTAPRVVVSARALTVAEGAQGIYTVWLDSQPIGSVTVTVSLAGAATGATVEPTELVFTVSDYGARTVTVTVTDDMDVEADARATLSHAVSGADYGAAGVTAEPVTVTVPGHELTTDGVKLLVTRTMVTVPSGTPAPAGLSLLSLPDEHAGTTVTIRTVRTAAMPGDPRGFRLGDTVADIDGVPLDEEQAMVCLPTAEEGDLSVQRWDATATPMTWDLLDEPVGGSPSGQVCGETSSFSVFAVMVALVEPVLTFSVESLRVEIGEEGASYTVALDAEPMGLVTVAIRVDDAGAAELAVAPAELMFTEANWAAPQTVTVAVPEETEPGEASLLHMASGGRYLERGWSATLMVRLAQDTGLLARARQAWLARFGRTVAGQVAEAVAARLSAPAGPQAELNLGGSAPEVALLSEALQALGGEARPDARRMLTDSSFVLPLSDDADGGWTAWGEGAYAEFDSTDGDLEIDGEVAGGTVGLDREQGRWRWGLALSRSEGDGEVREAEGNRVDYESSLTGVHPYARWHGDGGLSAWGVLGWGEGDLEETHDGERSETDLEMRMAVLGASGPLGTYENAFGEFGLNLKSEAMAVRMEADADAALPEVTADASRLRLLLEGVGHRPLESGGLLVPRLEAGLRWDGGDAETGLGAEIGAALRYVDPSGRLSAEFTARGLLTHEESNYEEWGVSGALRLEPNRAGRGLSLKLESGYGPTGSGLDELWRQHDLAGLAPQENVASAGRLEAELGYGLNSPGGRGMLTPYAAYRGDPDELRLGARLDSGEILCLDLSALRRRRGEERYGIELRVDASW